SGRDVLELVPLEKAEAAVFPGRWEDVVERPGSEEAALRLSRAAAAAGMPMLIFYWSDSDMPVRGPGAVVFRTSVSRSRRRHGEHAQPTWSGDLVADLLDGRLPVT